MKRWSWHLDLEIPRRWVAAGRVLALPTESSYGLGVDAGNSRAVERVYRLKGRDRGKPLPVVVGDGAQVARWVDREHPLVELALDWWPAPLTVVVPSRERLAATAGGATLALRIPAHEGLRRLARALEFPLTATSANLAGEPAILDPTELVARLGGERVVDDDLIDDLMLIDDGLLPGGAPSTLVDWQEGAPRLLRPGAFPFERLLATRAPTRPTPRTQE